MTNLFSPKILEETQSKFSGKLLVKTDIIDTYVTTGILTQSGGTVIKEVWNAFFKKFWWWKLQHKDWLIFGLATGTVATMISKKYKPEKLVGVEIDPEMVRIGRKYFKLDEIPNLEIKVMDASKYKFNQHFDYILVDMYIGDQMPAFVYSDKFLKNIRKHSTVSVFNHLFYDPDKRANAEKLIKSLDKLYNNIVLVRVLTNVLVICS